MSDGMSERVARVPRWALERVEVERCKFLGAQPNMRNVDVWMREPFSWHTYYAWADYIARTEQPEGRNGAQ